MQTPDAANQWQHIHLTSQVRRELSIIAAAPDWAVSYRKLSPARDGAVLFFDVPPRLVCTENLNPNVVMMKSAKDRA